MRNRVSARVLPVAQTSKSAVSRVSKPAGRPTTGDAPAGRTRRETPRPLPIWKSAIQQVWKPALRVAQASSPASSGGVSPRDSLAGARTPRQLAAEDGCGTGAVVRHKA